MSCLQDLGRRGGGRSGLSLNGASDQYSAQAANILVGSPRDAVLLELTVLDLAFRISLDAVIAVTGARADVLVDGHPAPQWEPVVVRAGSRVDIRRIRTGVRVYLAVHGVISAPSLLGSATPDLAIGFGANLTAGDVIELRTDCPPVVHPFFDIPVFALHAPLPRIVERWTIDVTDGPDIAEFPEARRVLEGAEYAVTPRSNHVGLRLRGDRPHRVVDDEVVSRGVAVGAVEVPPGDEILVLHRGRGVTAGYAIPAVVTTVSLDALGQARPGHTVRFRWRTVSEGVAAQRSRSAALEALERRVRTVFEAVGVPHSGVRDLSGCAT